MQYNLEIERFSTENFTILETSNSSIDIFQLQMFRRASQGHFPIFQPQKFEMSGRVVRLPFFPSSNVAIFSEMTLERADNWQKESSF